MSVFNQKCDECGYKSLVVIADDDEVRDIRNKMKSSGWTFKHAKSYCLTCAKNHPVTIPVPRPEYDRLKLAEETLLALEWAQEKRACGDCPMQAGEESCDMDMNSRWCKEGAIAHRDYWLSAYREHKQEAIP